MRIFVSGASGFIGAAVVRELLGAGHSVLGLARSEASARAIDAAGADVHRGSLEDVASLRAAARAADGVIHLAFIHDFSNFEASIKADHGAIEAYGEALAGSNKPLAIASGMLGLAPGRTSVETDHAPPAGRGLSESMTLALASRGVRSAVVRLPPSVHGAGDHGFVAHLVKQARETGAAIYVGDGANHWPAVHRDDAARLFRLAVERGAPGSVFHAIGDAGIPFRDIATLIGRRVGVPVQSKTADEAGAYVGFLARFITMDGPSSASITRAQLGWEPREPGLLADMDAHYFAG